MESRELTPEQRRHRTAALAALAIGGVTLFGIVAGSLGGDDSPSQTIADKNRPDTEAILAREKRENEAKEKLRAERIERRAAKRRKAANREWQKLKDNYDAMKGQGGTDPGGDTPASTPSTPTPEASPAQPQPQAPATTPSTPPQATPQSAPTTPASPPSGGGGDPRFYGIP